MDLIRKLVLHHRPCRHKPIKLYEALRFRSQAQYDIASKSVVALRLDCKANYCAAALRNPNAGDVLAWKALLENAMVWSAH